MNYINILDASDSLCKSEAGYRLFGFVGYIVEFIQIAVPIIIILWGTIDLVKALIAQSPDQTKKAQTTFVKRLITGVVIFFVPMIVMFLINMINGNNNEGNICLQSFSNPEQAMKNADDAKKAINSLVDFNDSVSQEECEAKGGYYYAKTCTMQKVIDLNQQVQIKG